MRILVPFVDKMEKIDVREFPMTGDQQAVITKDNVSLQVSATIFCQVIDVKSALFEINDYQLAVDQLSRTALRAVFGELSLDQALSERETINSRMQDHMADATAKWGVRLNRIEILDITPPMNVVQAMSEQKEAEQHKRAAILKSEGEQQAAVNTAGGRKQAAVLEAEGAKQSAILRAEAQMKVLELQAEGEKKALELRGEGEASRLTSIDTATINPRTLAVLQLQGAPGHRGIGQRQSRGALRGDEPHGRGRGAALDAAQRRPRCRPRTGPPRRWRRRRPGRPTRSYRRRTASAGRPSPQAQPSSRRRASPMPKWWPTSWRRVTRTLWASSSIVRADWQIVARNSVIRSGLPPP